MALPISQSIVTTLTTIIGSIGSFLSLFGVGFRGSLSRPGIAEHNPCPSQEHAEFGPRRYPGGEDVFDNLNKMLGGKSPKFAGERLGASATISEIE